MGKNKKNITRREFIEKSSIGLAAFGSFYPLNVMTGKRIFRSYRPEDMITRPLGKTGIRVPVVSLGVMNADNPNVVQHAIDKGIILLDTAYGYQRGKNEEMIGNVLKKNGKRKDIIIISKIPSAGRRRRGGDTSQVSPEAIKKDFIDKFNESLKRLQTDYIDIQCQHGVSTKEMVHSEPIKDALSQLKKEGKIRFPAFSTHSNQAEVIDEAGKGKFYEVIVTSQNIIDSNKEGIKEACARATEAGIGIVAMKTQCGGYLDRNEARRKRVKPTKPVNHKACLRWVMQDENIATSIPGCTAFDQIDELMEVAYDLKMTDDEKGFIEKAGEMSSAFYCSGCENCKGTCPKNVDVPTIMRTFMYTFAYKNAEHAHITYNDIPEEHNLSNCDECEECTVKCINGLKASENLSIMKEVFA